ncbi:hypothetical protein E2562_011753 [Oryza meyeriana var. granulata]|uniref:DUF834 domain-containing protein n=1 Tax=Oryza meyeriana var. granulata TaxID=110450 RepID=A0A6G1CQH8_9ORYZ|nr:hypothetical protein E2562_011753 [Oryza meyeriana var. granulata]
MGARGPTGEAATESRCPAPAAAAGAKEQGRRRCGSGGRRGREAGRRRRMMGGARPGVAAEDDGGREAGRGRRPTGARDPVAAGAGEQGRRWRSGWRRHIYRCRWAPKAVASLLSLIPYGGSVVLPVSVAGGVLDGDSVGGVLERGGVGGGAMVLTESEEGFRSQSNWGRGRGHRS